MSEHNTLTLHKLYAKTGDDFRPSAWWAVRELPGLVVCYMRPRSGDNGWCVLLVAERLGANLPWDSKDVSELVFWWPHEFPLPAECPKHIRQSLQIINKLHDQTYATRKEAVQSIQGCLLSLS